jgi:hypothetical protein
MVARSEPAGEKAMRSACLIAAASLLWLAAAPPASAYVEFGRPDYSNYLAPYGLGTCDWWTEAWVRACPGVLAVVAAPVAVAVPAGPAVVKAKKSAPAKTAK